MKQTIKRLFSLKNRAVTYLILPFITGRKPDISRLFVSAIIAIFLGILPVLGTQTQSAEADFRLSDFNLPALLSTIQGNSLLPIAGDGSLKTVRTISVVVTAYSSTAEETDDTPFITASNTVVRDGIIANNLLAFGTRVRMPEIFGDKTFTVEDRMNSSKSDYHVDVWFPTYQEAKQFGARIAELEVIE